MVLPLCLRRQLSTKIVLKGLKKTLLLKKIFKYSVFTVHCKEKYLWNGFLASRDGIMVSKFASVQHTSLPRIHQLIFAPACQKQLLQRFSIGNNGGLQVIYLVWMAQSGH